MERAAKKDKANEHLLKYLDRQDRCLRVILLILVFIQVLLLSAILLPEDPPILEIPSDQNSSGKIALAFKYANSAAWDAKDTNVTLPMYPVGPKPPDEHLAENADRVNAEPADDNLTTGYEEMDSASSGIASRLSRDVSPKLNDQPAASGIEIKPSDRTTTVDIKEEDGFVPFPCSNGAAKQTQSPNAKVDSHSRDNATTAVESTSVDPAVNADVPRSDQGRNDTIADRPLNHDVAGEQANRPEASPASGLGGREKLPALDGLALLPLLDQLHPAAPRQRFRPSTVAAAAAAATAFAPKAAGVACAIVLLLRA